MYAVVQCPSCRWARGVRQTAKRSSCPRCGRRFPLDGTVFVARATDVHQLADEVARVNAATPPGGTEQPDERLRNPPRAEPPRRPGPSVRDAARKAILEATQREITTPTLERILAEKGHAEPVWRAELERLLAENSLFEPRPGRLRRT